MLAGAVCKLTTIVCCASSGVALATSFAAVNVRAADSAPAATAGLPVEPRSGDRGFVQYGVALAAEIVALAGPACADPASPCILGSGGGVVARVGWRPNETLYIGGAYEMSKQEPHELYRLALLQQVRLEMRRYLPTGRDATPFLLVGAGVGTYGNEWWPVDTFGPSATLGVGVELQLGRSVLLLSLAYRPIYFHSWVDSSLLAHDAGFAHFVGLEAAVEAQDTP